MIPAVPRGERGGADPLAGRPVFGPGILAAGHMLATVIASMVTKTPGAAVGEASRLGATLG